MTYDKPIVIQRLNEDSEAWEDLYTLHARVNKSSGSEYLNAGASQSRSTLVFETRYFKDMESIDDSRDLYRIVYRGRLFNITDYDDYQEQHKTVKLLGVSYGY